MCHKSFHMIHPSVRHLHTRIPASFRCCVSRARLTHTVSRGRAQNSLARSVCARRAVPSLSRRPGRSRSLARSSKGRVGPAPLPFVAMSPRVALTSSWQSRSTHLAAPAPLEQSIRLPFAQIQNSTWRPPPCAWPSSPGVTRGGDAPHRSHIMRCTNDTHALTAPLLRPALNGDRLQRSSAPIQHAPTRRQLQHLHEARFAPPHPHASRGCEAARGMRGERAGGASGRSCRTPAHPLTRAETHMKRDGEGRRRARRRLLPRVLHRRSSPPRKGL